MGLAGQDIRRERDRPRHGPRADTHNRPPGQERRSQGDRTGGQGGHFSCGTEIGWLRDQASAPLNTAMADMRKLAQMLQTLAECGVPTIARVQGLAMGMAVGLAAACDICVAAEDAVFHITDSRVGMLPTVISPYLVRAIGERQCRRYFQTTEGFGAARARELGLAHEVVPRSELDRHIESLITSLLACDPMSQASASSLIRLLAVQAPRQDSAEALLRAGAKLRARPSLDTRPSPLPAVHLPPSRFSTACRKRSDDTRASGQRRSAGGSARKSSIAPAACGSCRNSVNRPCKAAWRAPYL